MTVENSRTGARRSASINGNGLNVEPGRGGGTPGGVAGINGDTYGPGSRYGAGDKLPTTFRVVRER